MDEMAINLDSNEDTMSGKFLTFKVAKETYGIEIRYVIDIVGIQPLTEMPEMPQYMKGIINLRGKVIPIMDVRLRLKMSGKEYDDRTCIIVVDMNGLSIGLVIDLVCEVLTITDDEIMKKPELITTEGCDYIKNIARVDNQVVLLIDCGKLLSTDDCGEVAACLS